MDLLKDLRNFKCLNHKIDEQKILSNIFDIYNPCSFCKNHLSENPERIAFYKEGLGRWEFPYAVEGNCKNFASIITKENIIFYGKIRALSPGITFIEYRDSRFNDQFGKNFYEVSLSDLEGFTFYGNPIPTETIIFPNDLSHRAFSRELAIQKQELVDLAKLARETPDARFNRIEAFAITNFQNLLLLEKQIKELTSSLDKRKPTKPLRVQVLKFALNNAAGGALWDLLKVAITKCYEMINASE